MGGSRNQQAVNLWVAFTKRLGNTDIADTYCEQRCVLVVGGGSRVPSPALRENILANINYQVRGAPILYTLPKTKYLC